MQVSFDPPGPGCWALDRSHYPGGTTPISQWLIGESMPAGMERVMAEIGAPVRRIDARFVHGFMYTRIRPLIGGGRAPRRLPPAPVLRLVSHVHPEFRRRARRAARTLADRPSLEVAERWDREIRPALRARNRALQDVDPTALDDDALQAHVGELLDHAREQFELHFWLHGHDLGPIARYLHSCIGWGLDPERAIEALAGASPSTARPAATLRRLRELVDAGGRTITSLDDVRAVSDEAAALLDDHLADHGNVVVTGYDLTAFTLAELPRLVVESIRTAAEPVDIDHRAIAASLRAEIPDDDRSTFDMVLADARAVMDMRDDNGPLTAEWPVGLLRRALLAAGTRLTGRGVLIEPTHLLEVTPDEARALFTGALPDARGLEARSMRRAELAALTPPDTLGDPEPEPPLDVLPDPLPTVVAMIRTSLRHLGMDGSAAADGLAGVGIGTACYTGRARTAASADEAIDKLEPGDVLIVRATSPAFNAVLALAGAVVTANGGAMSHAAVLARELGIPAVVGAGSALAIPDGSQVEVDPIAGRVRVVAPAPT